MSLSFNFLIFSEIKHAITNYCSYIWFLELFLYHIFCILIKKISYVRNIDGNVIHGEVKEKAKAKAQYDKAVSQGQSAGYVAAT